MREHPGTEGLRELREDLIDAGIALDQNHTTTQKVTIPNDERAAIFERMNQVVRSSQYDLSAGSLFLADAAAQLFSKVSGSDGVIREEDVGALGEKASSLFALLVDGYETQKRTPEVFEKLPANALGQGRTVSENESVILPAEVLKHVRFGGVRLTDMIEHQKRLEAHTARKRRRDPATRIAKVMHEGAEIPRVAAIETLKRNAPKDALKNTKLFCLQHLYASTQSILDAAVECGVRPEDVTIMGKPYSGSMNVAAQMVKSKYNVVLPSLHQSEHTCHHEHMESLICEQVVRLLAQPGNDPIMVIDDGGQVANVIATKFKNAQHRFKIVEQTQRGANLVRETKGLRAPVVNVAESFAKKDYESPSIAHSVFIEVKKVIDSLTEASVEVKKSATILGFGAIGAASARKLRDEGYDVHIYDPGEGASARAKAEGFNVHDDKREALSKAHVLIGASGRTAFEIEDAFALPESCVMFNAASSNNELNATNFLAWQMISGNKPIATPRIGRGVEFRREHFYALDTATLDENHELHDTFCGKSVHLGSDASATQTDRVIHFKDKELYLVNAGFVVNLTDDNDPIPPRYIGLTRGLLFAALLQARNESGAGLVDLEQSSQRVVLEATEADLAKSGESLLDPSFQ